MAERWDNGPSLSTGGEEISRYGKEGSGARESWDWGGDRESPRIRIPFFTDRATDRDCAGRSGRAWNRTDWQVDDAKKCRTGLGRKVLELAVLQGEGRTDGATIVARNGSLTFFLFRCRRLDFFFVDHRFFSLSI